MIKRQKNCPQLLFCLDLRAIPQPTTLGKLKRDSISALKKEGFKVAAFNFKGTGIPQKTGNLFDFRYKDKEVEFVVDYIKKKYPLADVYLIGFSMGASVGMKYLASEHGQKNIKGMVSISNPWDVYKAAQNLNSNRNLIYGRFLTKKLYSKAIFNVDCIERAGFEIDWKKLENTWNTFQFDEHFTFKINKDDLTSEKYYKHMSCYDKLDQIKTPVLVIQSENDFIAPIEMVPFEKITKKPNFFYVGVPRAAHVEYFTKFGLMRWYARPTAQYLSCIHKIGKETLIEA